MKSFVKTLSAAALAVAVVVPTFAVPANAGSRGDVAAGVVGGLIVGGIIGSAAANARPAPPPAYYYGAGGPDCGEFRRRASYNESIGRFERADYWRARYHRCRG